MSTIGNAESYIEVKGTISVPDLITGKSAYEIALLNGFKGTEAEWVDWLRNGVDGKDGVSGVYVGSGEMPEGYNVQIDPSGEATDIETALDEILAIQESLIGGEG